MSWSLKVSHGDLALGNNGLGLVTIQDKLLQDLRLWILEHMGTDPYHPGHGSLLDGGTLPDGTEVPGVVGKAYSEQVTLEIDQEIRRVVSAYQRQQLVRAKNDRLQLNRATLSAGEVVVDIRGLSFTQVGDSVYVTVQIENGAGQAVGIDLPLSQETGVFLRDVGVI